MYRLEVHNAKGKATSYVLIEETTTSIGRNPGNDIVLDHPSVSRSHCLLYLSSGTVEIEDLGSKNGVKIGRRRVTTRTEVPVDQELIIGKLRCFLRQLTGPGSVDETTIQSDFVRPEHGK